MKQTTTVLHVINIKKVFSILSSFKINAMNLKVERKKANMIMKEIDTSKAKVKLLVPNQHRSQRGLLNIVGNTQK